MNALWCTRVLVLIGVFVHSDHGVRAAEMVPSCAQLIGQTVKLRGKVSQSLDNIDADFGEDIVLDPVVEVLLVRLHRPICLFDADASSRPVTQTKVTVVELVPGGTLSWADLRSHVGRRGVIEGTLSENEVWHYKATMRIAVTHVR